MTTTVKQIAQKVSLLRSQVAVYEGLLHHLQSNYVGTADTEPESTFVRSDYGVVPPDHLEQTMALIAEMASTATAEISALEDFVVVLPQKPAELPAKEKKNAEPRPPGRRNNRPATS